jgi:hypothetical protein
VRPILRGLFLGLPFLIGGVLAKGHPEHVDVIAPSHAEPDLIVLSHGILFHM